MIRHALHISGEVRALRINGAASLTGRASRERWAIIIHAAGVILVVLLRMYILTNLLGLKVLILRDKLGHLLITDSSFLKKMYSLR